MENELMWRKVLEKWFGVWALKKVEKASTDCAFCLEFLYKSEGCTNCPIYEETGVSGCGGNKPYQDFSQHKYNARNGMVICDCRNIVKTDFDNYGNSVIDYDDHYHYCEEALSIALQELRFLMALCPYRELVDEYDHKINVMIRLREIDKLSEAKVQSSIGHCSHCGHDLSVPNRTNKDSYCSDCGNTPIDEKLDMKGNDHAS